MAKNKKSDPSTDGREENLIIAGICKKYGKIIQSGTEVLNQLESYKLIGISPALDLALGGGLREGTCVNMTGDPKTGKTTTALYFAAKAQQLGKKVYYLNTEGRLSKHNFNGIKGLNVEDIEIIQTSDETPQISAETYLNTLENLIKQEPQLVAIVDSVSNMIPQEELDGEIRTGVRNGLPRLLSMFFKRTSGDVSRMKAIVIFITHNIANTGGSRYAPSKMADSGNMLQYQVNTNMVITHRGKWEVPKESGNHVGQVANWKILTSAAGGRPNSTAESWIRYGLGIDESQELAQVASQFALVSCKGAWYSITAFSSNKQEPVVLEYLKNNEIDPDDNEAVEKSFKFQGMENLVSFLSKHPELQSYLMSQVKELIA
jgi:recombination protein RecA